MVTLHILHDSEREMREALMLVLRPDENMIADTEVPFHTRPPAPFIIHSEELTQATTHYHDIK